MVDSRAECSAMRKAAYLAFPMAVLRVVSLAVQTALHSADLTAGCSVHLWGAAKADWRVARLAQSLDVHLAGQKAEWWAGTKGVTKAEHWAAHLDAH